MRLSGSEASFRVIIDSQWPLYFPAIKGMIFPAYHVFKFLLANKSMSLIRSVSSKPLTIDCLAMTDGKQVRYNSGKLTPRLTVNAV